MDRARASVVDTSALTIRSRRAIIASVIIAAVGACLSYKLVDRLAISNIAQVLGIVVLLAGNPRLLRHQHLAWWISAAGGVFVAAFVVLSLYDYEVQWQYPLFYGLALLWILAVIQICRTRAGSEAVVEGLRIAIPIVLIYLLAMLAIDLGGDSARRRLGFDDKSHASVYACILAFASLRFLRTRWRLLIALAFLTLSLLTISRLPFLFAPGFLIAFLIEYGKVRRQARSALDVYLCHLLLIAAFVAPIAFALTAGDLFDSFNRVFRAGVRADASTQAHLFLLQYAGELKLDNISNFLFGVTPGGYSGTLIASGIDVSGFAATDPAGFEKMLEGTAPMHSSTGTILLEFPIWIGVAYVVLIVWSIVRLIKLREWVVAIMLVSLVIATTLYSSVTELYFSLALSIPLATIGLHAADERTDTQGGHARR